MPLIRGTSNSGITVDALLVGNQGIHGIQVTRDDMFLDYGQEYHLSVIVRLEHDGTLVVQDTF